MDESNRVVFVPHCLLNQSIRSNLGKKSNEKVKDLIHLFLDSGVGIVQLPCPEIEFNGKLKKYSGKVYKTKNYKEHCQGLSLVVSKEIKKYLDSDYNILGIFGIEFSPTCAVHKINNGKKVDFKRGIFIEELEKQMQKQNFQVPIVPVNLNNVFSTLEKIDLLLKNY